MADRTNLQIAVGSYVGTGSAGLQVTGLGFSPKFVIVKGGSGNGAWKTDAMPANNSAFLTNVANVSGAINQLITDGFVLGTDTNVNTNGVTYYYLAIGGRSPYPFMGLGRYSGNSTNNRIFTDAAVIAHTPDIAIIKNDGTQTGVFTTSALSTGNTTDFKNGVGDSTTKILALLTNGFKLGTGLGVNFSNAVYYYATFKNISGCISTGTFIGNGASQSINVGFQPDFIIIRDYDSIANNCLFYQSIDGSNRFFASSASTDSSAITAVFPTGFTVGSSGNANNNGQLMCWIAFKAGRYYVPVSRTNVS